MEKRGLPIVVSGFSGAGKGTLMNLLLERYDDCALSVSATTRAPRPGEKEGVNYFYVSHERFEEMIRQNELYEYTQYQGNYYGTPRKYVDDQLAAGKDIILEIEVEGAMNMRKLFPNALLIFVAPPCAKTLRDRLTGRKSETEEQICGRLRRAREEALCMPQYDYLLVNDDLEKALDELRVIIESGHHRMSENEALIQEITEELNLLSI